MLACRQAWWYMQDTSSRYDLHNVQSHTQPQSINQSVNKSSIIIIFSTLVSSLLRQIYLYIFYSNYLISLCNIYVWHHDVQTCTPKLILLVWHKPQSYNHVLCPGGWIWPFTWAAVWPELWSVVPFCLWWSGHTGGQTAVTQLVFETRLWIR